MNATLVDRTNNRTSNTKNSNSSLIKRIKAIKKNERNIKQELQLALSNIKLNWDKITLGQGPRPYTAG